MNFLVTKQDMSTSEDSGALTEKQSPKQNKEKAIDDLYELMKSFQIESMYENFHKNGVTIAVIWELDDDVLDNVLQLNSLEKIKYKKAKKYFD